MKCEHTTRCKRRLESVRAIRECPFGACAGARHAMPRAGFVSRVLTPENCSRFDHDGIAIERQAMPAAAG